MMGRLARILDSLEQRYGPQSAPPLDGPFEMLLWEMVAYLQPDDRRSQAFAELKRVTGATTAGVLKTPGTELIRICRMGGSIASEDRAGRIRWSAEHVIAQFGGDLATVLRLPPPKAKRELMKFPMIGEPGAEKILLFTHTHPVLAVDSNGMRVLTRLGFGRELKSYPQSYRSVREATFDELPASSTADCPALIRAHLLLKKHGQDLCFRNEPACAACPLHETCPSARS